MRTIVSLACLAALTGCAIIVTPNDDVQVHSVFSSDGVKGDGRLASEQRPVTSLPGLDVSGPMHVDVRVGGKPGLSIEADSNLLPMIRSEVAGDTVRIWIDGKVNTDHNIRVTYNVPQLTHLRATGSGRMDVSGLNGAPLTFVKTGSGQAMLSGRVSMLDVRSTGSGAVNAAGLYSQGASATLTGSGRITLGQVRGEQLSAHVKGSGDIEASGEVQSLNASVHGSGDVHLARLTAQRADLSTNGSGDISALVKQSLVAYGNGSGRITVHGNPSQRNVSGKRVEVLN
ncbi:MAG: GIN domain-containing protein [Telluria sp.]